MAWEYMFLDGGNLLSKSVTKCSAENISLSVSALGNNQLSGYGYDAAGNMTSNATTNQSYSYDPENRITGAAGFLYTYDADGNRVEKSSGTSGTLYWYMTPGIVAESDLSGNLSSEYVFFGGERVARIDLPGNTVHHFLSDHLHSTTLLVGPTGAIENESEYYPWGGERQFSNTVANHYKFTGKERDSETNLDYFGARYYSNSLGRFITPDWAAKATAVPYAEFADPQSLNLYSYVRNVPTTRYDADGHDGGTAEAVWEILTGGSDVTGGFWAAGSVALPGVLGGGLAYGAINTIASNNYAVANAQMQDVVASNNLVIARQQSLSKDAEAGALITAGKDATDKASATVDAAIKDIA